MTNTRATDRPAPARVLIVLLAAAALVGVSGWLTESALAGWQGVVEGGAREFEPLVAAPSASAAAVIGWWLTVSVLISTVHLLRGLPRPAVSAKVVHRTVAIVLGVGLSAGALPAVAATPTPPSASWTVQGWGTATPAPSTTTTTTTPDPGGWLPAPPPAPDVVVGGTRPPTPETSTDASVVVVRGDSLWRIAAEHLGPQATDAEIAEAWPAWYEANADVIGEDPDLIYPGQELRIP